jgi:uncharacterized membrane protein
MSAISGRSVEFTATDLVVTLADGRNNYAGGMSVMHMLITIVVGLGALAVFYFGARLFGRSGADGAFVFIWVWLAASLFNGAVGVFRAGIPAINEVGAFILIFGIPAAASRFLLQVWQRPLSGAYPETGMGFLDRFKCGELRLTRIEMLSDGVFAIVLTLLVLELKVPALKDHGSVSELAHQLVELMPKFLSWLISFIIVCKFWLNHDHILGLARHADYGFVWLNAIFLMGQSFIPFPTALVGEYSRNPLAVSIFGIMFAINTLLFLALQAYILRRLIKPELAAQQDPHAIVKGFIGPASYLMGAAAAWFSVYAAFVIYALTPLFYITPWQYRQPAGKGIQ